MDRRTAQEPILIPVSEVQQLKTGFSKQCWQIQLLCLRLFYLCMLVSNDNHGHMRPGALALMEALGEDDMTGSYTEKKLDLRALEVRHSQLSLLQRVCADLY